MDTLLNDNYCELGLVIYVDSGEGCPVLRKLMLNNCFKHSIANTITVDDDALRELIVDFIVLGKSTSYADFQTVDHLLSRI